MPLLRKVLILMKSLFNLDSPIIEFLNRVTDIFLLNLLFLICCIPIITVGPSITALYYCTINISRKQDSSIFRMFFHSFTNNLKQGMLLGLLFSFITVFLLFEVYICSILSTAHLVFVQLFILIMLLFPICMSSYAFPILAQFNSNTKNILKNAFFLSIYNFPYTLIIVFLNLIPVLLLLIIPRLFLLTLLLWLTFGFSCIAMMNSAIFVKIFDRYIPENESQQ